MVSNVVKFIGLMVLVLLWRNFLLQILLIFLVGWKVFQNIDFDLFVQRLLMVWYVLLILLYFFILQQVVVIGFVNLNFNGFVMMFFIMLKVLVQRKMDFGSLVCRFFSMGFKVVLKFRVQLFIFVMYFFVWFFEERMEGVQLMGFMLEMMNFFIFKL